MRKTLLFCLAITLVLGMFQQAISNNSPGKPEGMPFKEVSIVLTGTAETKADYFAGQSAHSVILAPGAMFSKESWHFLADYFQKFGISSVALNSGSTPDLLNAIAFLKTKGANEITLVGASAGGAGVLYALQDNIDPIVNSVILLAPAGGLPIKNEQIKKLFIVAEDDMVSSNAEVYKLYINSSDPKLYREYKGSEHAQRLFDGKHREDIIQIMMHFIQN